ncbi:hypothetical protein SLEP1_g29875 [Rubroshorea leprosula]|uniref:CRC domain-containing protein n=1 Tax=Rubroshorea leprosula TaxID=152421 RepID=A0AAV5K814_9ROSI|nr:hypothetical protein SLEP1_g29875 [Rubroshorea leprosula]
MDTPQKTQISSTSLSKFEDSPIFNYINSLSPIKPVKSIHITQTFNPLSFASLPPIFTSPHVSAHKESRFPKRNNRTDPSKTDSEEGNKASTEEEVDIDAAQLCDNSAGLQESFDPGVSIGEASLELTNESSKFVIELPRTLKYDCGSPNCDPVPYATEAKCGSELGCTSVSVVPLAHDTSEKDVSENGVDLASICQTEEKRETTGCDWGSLISDAADLLIFSSPNDSEAFRGLFHKSLESSSRFCTSLVSHFPQTIEQKEHPSLQTEEAGELMTGSQTQGNVEHQCTASSPTDKVDNESVSNLYRGIRRRCLDFETLGARRKNLDDDGSNSNSSVDKQLVPMKPRNESSRCILPGIGLHLNALAVAARDNKKIKHETLSSGRQKISIPSSTASILPLTTGQEAVCESLTSASAEREMDPTENGIQLAEDASLASPDLANEDLNQNSPKKKRRKSESAGEGEACKRCNCKKSKCLKLYCECFAAGVYCIEPCSCQDCFNKPIHEDTVLATRKQIESRNPLAFAPKVIRSSDSISEIGDESSKTPASARHKRGCNCKKSNCLKKYCECYQGGVGCSISCRCEGCKNAFGRKDGSAIVDTEEEPEEETETHEKNGLDLDKTSHKPQILNEEEQQNPVSALPTTPLQLCRPLVPLPFSSKGKPPRSFMTVGSSSGLLNGQRYAKANTLRPQNKSEKQFQTVQEDEMPEILRANFSPGAGIKTTSPNSKRISPPHCELGSSSPSRRSGRKLILQSIPSFPSLTQH